MNNFHKINHLPSRTIDIDGREYLYFSGTAYLGLPQNTAFQALIQEGLHQYGSVYGSSRNGNLQLSIYEEAEAKLAAWTGADAALTLSSGMLAGQAAVRQLMLENYGFVYSPDVHPAVWHLPDVRCWTVDGGQWTMDGGCWMVDNGSWRLDKGWWTLDVGRSRFDNDGAAHLQISPDKLAIVTNSVDALRGRLYDFEWVNIIPDHIEVVLLIDDSHGLGVTGAEGRGIWQSVPKRKNVRLIVTASLAKAMGLPGGVIFSDSETIQKIRNTAYFGGCSPIAPDHLYAYLHADTLYAAAYAQLQSNIHQFVESIKDLNLFSFTQGYPVFYTESDDLYPFLLEQGVFIYSFAYPKPTDKANTRIVISAWHTKEDLQKLSSACRDFIAKAS